MRSTFLCFNSPFIFFSKTSPAFLTLLFWKICNSFVMTFKLLLMNLRSQLNWIKMAPPFSFFIFSASFFKLQLTNTFPSLNQIFSKLVEAINQAIIKTRKWTENLQNCHAQRWKHLFFVVRVRHDLTHSFEAKLDVSSKEILNSITELKEKQKNSWRLCTLRTMCLSPSFPFLNAQNFQTSWQNMMISLLIFELYFLDSFLK